MKRIIHYYAIVMLLLSSCDKQDILETRFHYADATINGYTFTDEHMLKQTGYDFFLPFTSANRFSLTDDGLALMQFKFVRKDNPSDEIYLFGGMTIPESESFPELNRTYEINPDINFIPNKDMSYYSEYVQNYLLNKLDPTSLCGIFMMIHYKNTDLAYSYSTSLGGTITFNSYNSKKGEYSGSFNFLSEDDIYKVVSKVTGTFCVALH